MDELREYSFDEIKHRVELSVLNHQGAVEDYNVVGATSFIKSSVDKEEYSEVLNDYCKIWRIVRLFDID